MYSSKVTMQQLAQAADVQEWAIRKNVHELEVGLFGASLIHRGQSKPKRIDSPELNKLAIDLLASGLKEKTVAQVLKDLYPELDKRHGRQVFSLVRAAKRFASTYRSADLPQG